MAKVNLDKSYIFNGTIYPAGELDIPDEMAIALGKMPGEKPKAKRRIADATPEPQA